MFDSDSESKEEDTPVIKLMLQHKNNEKLNSKMAKSSLTTTSAVTGQTIDGAKGSAGRSGSEGSGGNGDGAENIDINVDMRKREEEMNQEQIAALNGNNSRKTAEQRKAQLHPSSDQNTSTTPAAAASAGGGGQSIDGAGGSGRGGDNGGSNEGGREEEMNQEQIAALNRDKARKKAEADKRKAQLRPSGDQNTITTLAAAAAVGGGGGPSIDGAGGSCRGGNNGGNSEGGHEKKENQEQIAALNGNNSRNASTTPAAAAAGKGGGGSGRGCDNNFHNVELVLFNESDSAENWDHTFELVNNITPRVTSYHISCGNEVYNFFQCADPALLISLQSLVQSVKDDMLRPSVKVITAQIEGDFRVFAARIVSEALANDPKFSSVSCSRAYFSEALVNSVNLNFKQVYRTIMLNIILNFDVNAIKRYILNFNNKSEN
jgi:hypothetical protein